MYSVLLVWREDIQCAASGARKQRRFTSILESERVSSLVKF